MTIIENLEALLERGEESALLHYSLGNAYLKEDEQVRAVHHFKRATEMDPEYSAAWKLYARALAANGNEADAIKAYETGIEVAEKKGDIQAVKEMKVFLKRLKDSDS